jgi:hypothetical protein
MLIMAEVTSEMGAELRASAIAAGTSVAAEVGRRLERLDRLEATVAAGSKCGWLRFGSSGQLSRNTSGEVWWALEVRRQSIPKA